RADGAAEALVKRFSSVVRKLAREHEQEWDELIPEVLTVLRSTHKQPLGMSPFEARLGFKMKLPSYCDMPEQEIETVTAKEKKRVKERIREMVDEAAGAMKSSFDKPRVESPFEEGQLIWLCNHDRESKLDVKRFGPYKVVKLIGEV